MLTFIFAILMIAVFGRLFVFSMKATWGILKVIVTLVLLPLALVGMVIGGLITLALPVLVIVGIIALVMAAAGR